MPDIKGYGRGEQGKAGPDSTYSAKARDEQRTMGYKIALSNVHYTNKRHSIYISSLEMTALLMQYLRNEIKN